MNVRVRRGIFLVSGAAFAGLYLYGLAGLPAFGHYRGPYGDLINAATVAERRITDAVTAVNFDFRGADTMIEEFILFTSVIGVTMLLRKQSDETQTPERDRAPDRHVKASEAIRVFSLGLVGLLVLFGLYVVAHGQLTPGGGFQGGVILATAPLLVYLAGDFTKFQRIAAHWLVELGEAIGAGAYVIVGLAGALLGGAFLQNFLPLGQTGSVFSGGTVPLIDASVGLEVAGGFVLLLMAFLEETLERTGGTQ